MIKSTMENLFYRSLRSKQIAITAIAFALFVSVISLVLYEGTKKSVTLEVNDEKTELKTSAHTVGQLLSDQEIEVADHDLVSPSVNTPIEEGLSIRWEQAKQVEIQIDQETKKVWTTESKVSDILAVADITLEENDEVQPSLQANLDDDQTISIQKAFQVTLVDGGSEKKIWSTSTTVADFLKRENIQLNEHDKLKQEADGIVTPGSVIEIVRVEKVTDVVEEPTNFAVVTQSDAKLLKGREKVVQEGKKGSVQRKFEVIKENGKEVSRTLLSEKVLEEPQKKIVSVGSKVMVAQASNKKPVTVSRGDSAPSGGKEFYVTATAYTAYCNGCTGKTATGINLRENPNLKVIAVDPSVIPLGSKVWVEGYGYAIAGDTGGAIKGKRIDLHVPTKSAAYNFGRRQVKVKIID
ncbi:ubiquitin-like domain-containing protein [Sporosarcina saromensis]|uniref:Ubiquitin-like domain-containing protein n=1 Tax=Sporosarcina saromensis TaxID=359365 RepID=A0ABU4GCI2_9BACL|nr:ubiquitin-like domain-containing protein [Sporosarcina saromensis]MDW0114696.1 ubiquitin-like domain-containing protein [Sporosarcina saromensis]